MERITRTALAAALACGAGLAGAQSNVTLYGDIDLYGNYMSSSSGNHIIALDDGALLRSRAPRRRFQPRGFAAGASRPDTEYTALGALRVFWKSLMLCPLIAA